MISFNYESDFILDQEAHFASWIETIIISESKTVGEISYVFCDDEYLHAINMQYLNHDTLTDIISFDYTEGDIISGDIFILCESIIPLERAKALVLNIDEINLSTFIK